MGQGQVETKRRRYIIAVDGPENCSFRVFSTEQNPPGYCEIPIVWATEYMSLGMIEDVIDRRGPHRPTEAEWQDLGRPRDHGEQ